MSRGDDDPDLPDDRPRPRRRPGDDDDEGDRPRRRRDDTGGERDDTDDRPRRRRRYDDEDDRRAAAGGSNTLATLGLVLGILSFCTGCLTGVPAVICSALALKRPQSKGLATAGLVLGVLGTVLSIPLGIGLLLPAVQKVREAASRQVEMNNQKFIGLGALNYESAYNGLPPADGPVSWRVHLLPYIEQEPLYRQFDVRQPWDSAKNRPLANTQVKTFASPLDPAGTTDTHYRVFTGPDTVFPPGRPPLRGNQVTDGTANTIFAVDAAEAVPWPQPKELPFTRTGPLPAVGHPGRNVAIVSMLDGSVRVVKKDKLTTDVLRALVTPAGGETVTLDW